ncbi:MAG: NAD(P)/FAD-dependent oxidoreductase [Flavobacteriales bacterium]|nr:NAD(P)/FAD-dependent oxidoreductase [Flavobacteriales bacterium]
MDRAEFLKKCAILGAGAPLMSMLLSSCKKDDLFEVFDVNFSGKVLVIGAGAAGLTAGYLLKRYDIDFEILEASPIFGGRLQRTTNFADFPIDLGAEWIHTHPRILSQLISDTSVTDSIEFIPYSPNTMYSWNNGKLNPNNWASNFYSEYKFKRTTWFGFFEKYFLPSVEDKLTYNAPVVSIDYSNDPIEVVDNNGNTHTGDKVLVTVPVKMLQNEYIDFTPSLPDEKVSAINKIDMPDGIKVFMEFSEKFYPDLLVVGPFLSALNEDSRIYFDAAFRKDSSQNILGLFSVGEPASAYTSLPTEQAIIDKILAELDEMFDGKASETYVKHMVWNWSNQPFIQGSYTNDVSGNYNRTIKRLARSVNDKLFFAGEATSVDNTATVHGAALSSYDAVKEILKG